MRAGLRHALALTVALLPVAVTAAAGEAFELRQLRCDSATCSTAEGIMPGLTTLEVRGLHPGDKGEGLRLLVEREGAAAPVLDRRVGVFANGEFRAALPVHLWPDGAYRFALSGAAGEGAPVATGRFVRTSASKAAPTRQPAPSANDLVGEWRGINGTAGLLQIAANGSYRFNGVAATYRVEGEEIVFAGPLAAWNGGRARLRSDVIEFQWKNREGFQNWFTFGRVR